MRWAAFLPALVFAALAALFYVAIFAGDPSDVPSALIGKKVPDFDLPPVEGMDTPGLATGDLETGEMTIVNVWASWCVPCRKEHPLLESLRAEGVRLVGLNYKDQPEAARRFLGQLGNPFERIGADRSGKVGIDWGVYGVPETFVVDGDGRIVHKHIGPLTARDIEETLLPMARGAVR